MRYRVLAAWVTLGISSAAMGSPIDQAKSSVVKVESGGLKGSGLYVAIEGQVYVVTSEHVVLHGNGGAIRHFVWNEKYGRREAQLVASDVGSGLALLRVPGISPAQGIVELDDFDPNQPVAGSRVSAIAFPHRVSTLYSSSRGEITNPLSDRGALPLIPWMIELGGTLAEYGMSGGPVYSQGDGLIVGFLSHQYVNLVPGKPSEVVEFGPNTQVVANQVVAIPAILAKEWILSAVRHGFTPWMIRDAGAQRARKTVLLAHGVKMAPEQGPSRGSSHIGGDGVGIGGDGIGIGGIADLDASVARAGVIRVVLTPDATTARWPSEKIPYWLQVVRKNLTVGKPLQIPAFLKRGSTGVEWIQIRSVVHFVNLLARADVSPIIQLPLGAGVPSAIEKASQTVLDRLAQLSEESQVSDLGNQVRSAARFAVSAEWAALLDADFGALIEHKEWNEFFSRDFDSAVEFMKAIEVLRQTLSQNRISQ